MCGTALNRKVDETLVPEFTYMPAVNTLLKFCCVLRMHCKQQLTQFMDPCESAVLME